MTQTWQGELFQNFEFFLMDHFKLYQDQKRAQIQILNCCNIQNRFLQYAR